MASCLVPLRADIAGGDYRALLPRMAPLCAEPGAEVDALIATKRPSEYDQAIKLLKDLRDLGVCSGRSAEIQAHIHRLRDQHVRKLSFLRRLVHLGSPPRTGRAGNISQIGRKG